MSKFYDARLAAFRTASGIEPASGEDAANLERIQNLVVQLLELIALERCGIRDGMGGWQGSDPIGGIIEELANLRSPNLVLVDRELWTTLAGDEGGSMTDYSDLLYTLKQYRRNFADQLDHDLDLEVRRSLAETHLCVLAVEAILAESAEPQTGPRVEFDERGWPK